MIKPHPLPDTICLFPLSGALLLPRGRLPLHIFEPRYLQMIEDCLKTPERLIGMVQPAGERLSAIGCAGRLTGFTETEDGRYMITLSGISRFRIRREVEGFTPLSPRGSLVGRFYPRYGRGGARLSAGSQAALRYFV